MELINHDFFSLGNHFSGGFSLWFSKTLQAAAGECVDVFLPSAIQLSYLKARKQVISGYSLQARVLQLLVILWMAQGECSCKDSQALWAGSPFASGKCPLLSWGVQTNSSLQVTLAEDTLPLWSLQGLKLYLILCNFIFLLVSQQEKLFPYVQSL